MDGKRKTRIILLTVLTLLIMIFIFCMSAQDAHQSSDISSGFLKTVLGEVLGRVLPRLSGKGLENDIRKYAHIFEFACLGSSSCLLCLELFYGQSSVPAKSGLTALLFGFLYACSDEIHQLFVPGRSGRFSDVLVDMIGILTAVAVVLSFKALAIHRKHGQAG